MNLYSRKQRWKIVLFLVAVAIAASSLWYTNHIVRKIKQDERLRIEIWSNAVRLQVQQLYLNNRFLDQMAASEEKGVKRWIRAMQEVSKDLLDYSFAIEVIQENKTVPVILTDDKGNYSSSGNLGFTDSTVLVRVKQLYPDEPETQQILRARKAFSDSIEILKNRWIKDFKPLAVEYRGRIKNYVYYKRSGIFERLQSRKDSLMESFNHDLVNNAALVPVVFTDSTRRNIIATNIEAKELGVDPTARIREMEEQNPPIRVKLDGKKEGYIFYEDSPVLSQVKLFPFIQTIIVGLFLLITYLIFNTFKTAEQNQVWAGMAKETAHQLGTPLSSLMAWNEILKSSGTDESITSEIEKDINRLNTVSERFSKIGSEPTLGKVNLSELIDRFANYLKPRISKNVQIKTDEVPLNVMVHANAPLIEWVLENISKNAVDAMEANGQIIFAVTQQESRVIVDISDTGKGIPSNKFKTVFKPGYSTKTRGWGLGLSLVKRIVEEYHDGKIFVLRSDVGKGTTFRIILNQA